MIRAALVIALGRCNHRAITRVALSVLRIADAIQEKVPMIRRV